MLLYVQAAEKERYERDKAAAAAALERERQQQRQLLEVRPLPSLWSHWAFLCPFTFACSCMPAPWLWLVGPPRNCRFLQIGIACIFT